MKRCHYTCRTSLLVTALVLSISGIAWAESTHKQESCGESSGCILTVLESFVTAVKNDNAGVSFNVGP